jgi:hypothetical protein
MRGNGLIKKPALRGRFRHSLPETHYQRPKKVSDHRFPNIQCDVIQGEFSLLIPKPFLPPESRKIEFKGKLLNQFLTEKTKISLFCYSD